MSLVDVVIPTRFETPRHFTLLHQIKSALHQGVDVRVVLLCSEENAFHITDKILPALSEWEARGVTTFTAPDGIKGDPFNTPSGYMCNPAILAYMESDSVGEWQMHGGDDDCLAPWALKYLLAASEGKGMVMGRAVAVNREFEDRRQYALGERIERCHIDLSCGIINTAMLRSLPRPWIGIETGYEDWKLVKRMADHFPYALIPQIVSIKSLTL